MKQNRKRRVLSTLVDRRFHGTPKPALAPTPNLPLPLYPKLKSVAPRVPVPWLINDTPCTVVSNHSRIIRSSVIGAAAVPEYVLAKCAEGGKGLFVCSNPLCFVKRRQTIHSLAISFLFIQWIVNDYQSPIVTRVL